MAPESMTYLDDKEIRHIFGLCDSTMTIIDMDGDFNDSWYERIWHIHQ